VNGHAAGEIAAYERALTALNALIRGGCPDAATRAARRRRAGARLERTRLLLAALGNPHHRYPIVHVTGTSGKGSTCAAIAAILTAAGYRVGLHTSPYLQVATEKLQIGASLIDAVSFADFVDAVLAEVGHLERAGRQSSYLANSGNHHAVPPLSHRNGTGTPWVAAGGECSPRFGYAEVWSALAFSWFATRDVDLAVVEVGAGGRFDATNVVQPAVSVITSVGLDHLVSLGPSLADIAWHKAGIIKPGTTAVIGDLPAEALAIVRHEARAAAVPLRHARDAGADPAWDLRVAGRFQLDNARIAVAAIEALRGQGFTIPDAAIAAGLAAARLPGRLELMPGSAAPRVWIDGAHNADKIAAVAREAGALRKAGADPVVVLGLLCRKDAGAIVAHLLTVASAIVATQPTVHGKRALPADTLAAAVRESGFPGYVASLPDPRGAIACATRLAAGRGADILVTGSLYLAGEVRRCWFPDAEIVRQRTPWPELRVGESGSGVVRAGRRLPGDEADRERDQPADHQDQAVVEELAIG
jgi:dihydrofolate synthase/folylpolyglutamate synthase